jgi:hypothetical protein
MDKDMIDEKDIVFVTTTLHTKWLGYQQKIIKKFFPNSNIILIDGRPEYNTWPNSWFYWINEVKKTDGKYFIHIDEDFFINDKCEFMKVLNKMESDDLDIVGCPDGYNHYRGANPVAINTFLMFGRISKLKQINIDNIMFNYNHKGWVNNYNLIFKEEYKKDFNYKFIKQGDGNFVFEQEPYYAFLWAMKSIGCKFDYLFPFFDERFKSTNPRIEEDSNDIGIHMWFTRNWNSQEIIHGLPNIERYEKIEKYLNEKI